MRTINDNFFKQIFAFVLVLSIAATGVVGVVVTLFPPNGNQLSLAETLAGLIFSSVFLLVAWAIWKWSQTCLLCNLSQTTRNLHH